MFMLLVVVLSGVSLVLRTPVSPSVRLVASAIGHPVPIVPRIVLNCRWNVVVLRVARLAPVIVQV